MKQLILDFINTYCTIVQDDDNVELMMDDHKYIEFEGEGYYVPDNNSFWGPDEELLRDFIIHKYSI